MSSEGSQSLTGYIEGDYLYLKYGDYLGNINISDDAKYYAENYEDIVQQLGDGINDKISGDKIVLKYEINSGFDYKKIVVEMQKSRYYNQILLEQKNEICKMRNRINELENKCKPFKIRVSSSSDSLNKFLENNQLIVQSFKLYYDSIDIVVVSLNNYTYSSVKTDTTGTRQDITNSCDKIIFGRSYIYGYTGATSYNDKYKQITFNRHNIGDRYFWTLIDEDEI
jgi:hypothetical protein